MTGPVKAIDDRALTGTSTNEKSPDARSVAQFHRYADTDARKEAIHHTLGTGANQSANGSHNHQGGDGVPLLSDTVFTGSRSANLQSVLKQVIDALVLLGATDATSA